MFPRLPTGDPIGLDFETTGLEYWQPDFRVLGVAVAHNSSSWYWDLRTTVGLVEWLMDTLPGRIVAAHNAQYDLQCARCLQIDVRAIDWFCTMVNAALINEHLISYSLSAVAKEWQIDSQKTHHLEAIRSAMGWRDAPEVLRRLSEVPPAMVAPYGASDASDALALYELQSREIVKQNLHIVSTMEMDLLPVLADMSWVGVRVDLEAAYAAIPMLDDQQTVLDAEVRQITGADFNVNSTPQIREFFKPEPINKYQWRLIDGTIVGPTKGGTGPCLDQQAMREIKHPLAQKILALRKTIKLRDTFLKGHIIGSADGDGFVHTQFNQTRNDEEAGTITGRLSSTSPALQQITGRDKVNAKILRSMFLPDKGHSWMSADYNQIDFRMAAHLINDSAIIAAYTSNPKTDYHQVISGLTGIPRNPTYAGAPNTKTLNLSLAFGAGPGKIAYSMGMPYEIKEYKNRMAYMAGPEAQAVFEKYHKVVPGVKAFSKQAENLAKETGFVRTQAGRRLRFPNRFGVHKAAGLLFQANAADVNKYGLIMVDQYIRDNNLDARLMLSVHDEIGVSMPDDPALAEAISSRFTYFNHIDSPLTFRVPITASTTITKTWWKS